MILADLEVVARDWIQNQSDLQGIAGKGLSSNDTVKMDRFQRSYVDQLREYGFSSYLLDEIGISHDSYRPIVAGVEMGVTSASDAVRSIWAYLLGALEVARNNITNHIGFVVFDEPKQQSAKDLSFEALLKRAAKAKEFGQQVICATSEDLVRLTKMLDGVDCDFKKYPTVMLVPMR